MLAPWKKGYNLLRQHIKKHRHYFSDKFCLVKKTMVFPVLIYGRESWSYYKESWAPKNWCFWTVALEKTLESPLDCLEIQSSQSNQPIQEISPEYSLEGLMLKLKLQYFGLMRSDSLDKTLMPGMIEGIKRRGWQKMGWVFGITNSMDMSLS